MAKWMCILGGVLLLAMAVFHASGLVDLTTELSRSNAPDFLKDIFPVLFVNTSIHLGTLALFAFLASVSSARRGICACIAIAVLSSAGLGLYLGEMVPAIVLGLITCLFVGAAVISRSSDPA